jgi:hypothetical protein
MQKVFSPARPIKFIFHAYCLLHNKCQLPEDGTVVPKHVAVIKDCTIVYAVCAFSCFSKRN